ncbi:MAG: alpha/beta hydrolase [Alphaproteobacteria bacterium]|nr:alpha/beta hydrolase [Alphaproteobacteria bacterium]
MSDSSEPIRRSLALDGGAMSYLAWPRQAPGLHFAHANGFNAQTYITLLTPLADSFNIVASDLRGHGQTHLPAPPGFATGWRLFAKDLMDALGQLFTKPAILTGHSMGAVASLMVATQRPDLVRALVLIEPVFVSPSVAARPGPDIADRAAKRRAIFPSVEAMEEAYRGRGAFKDWPDTVLRNYILGGTRPTDDGQVELTCEPRIEAEDFRSTPLAAYELASRVTCPVTLIRGDGPGSTCGANEAAEFVARKPDTRLITVPGASHFLPMEFPDIVRREILKSQEAGG